MDSFGCFDFSTTTSTLNFAAGTVPGGPGSQLCVNIPINDDICCELLESFQVGLSSTNPGVVFSGSTSLSVSILDNDSELLTMIFNIIVQIYHSNHAMLILSQYTVIVFQQITCYFT